MTDDLKYVVRIRRNSDGKIGDFRDSIPLEYAPNQEDGFFIWEEGNFACDCNRHSFFCKAVGEEDTEDDPPCGDERYSVLDIRFENGEVYYPEGKLK